jgi:hypothetical protein
VNRTLWKIRAGSAKDQGTHQDILWFDGVAQVCDLGLWSDAPDYTFHHPNVAIPKPKIRQ